MLPAVTSAFHVASIEQLCARASAWVVGPDRLFRPDEPEAADRRMVEDLMGLPPGHSRHRRAREVLLAHVRTITALGHGRLAALRSAFIVACQTPDVAGLGL